MRVPFQQRWFDYFESPRLKRGPRQVVTTESELVEMARVVAQAPRVAWDTETSGLAWHQHSRICGYSLAVDDASVGTYRSWYVPVRHLTHDPQMDPDKAFAVLGDILANPQQEKLAHNFPFDWHMAIREGLVLKGARRDTLIEASLYDENRSLALKERAVVDLRITDADKEAKMLSAELTRLAKEAGMKRGEYLDAAGYSGIPIYLAGEYACLDTEFVLGLADYYDSVGVRSTFADTYQREMDLQAVIVAMEEAGMDIDLDYLKEVERRTAEAKDVLQPQIQEMLGGYAFNLGSDAELRHVLLNVLQLKLTKTTKGYLQARRKDPSADKRNYYSVDREALSEHASQHPVIDLILEWRDADKINGTYCKGLLKRIGHDGRVHGSFKQVGTKTGRLSAENPNLQNIGTDSDARALAFSGHKVEDGGIDPFSIKRAFVCRTVDGTPYHRAFYDYSQVELRVLAYYSQDPTMLDVYAKGEDIHKRTQMEVFNNPDKRFRRMAKIINFGLSYCLSAQGFARQAKISEPEAEAFMRNFFARYPRIGPFRDEFWQHVRRNGCQFVNIFGRPRRVPALNAEGAERGRAERQAIGSLIQGTAAELTKISIIRLHRRIESEGLPAMLCSTVHDEIQVDFDPSVSTEMHRIAKEEMEAYPELAPVVPVTDVEVTDTSWADKREIHV